MKRLSEAQRRVMTYLTHSHGNYLFRSDGRYRVVLANEDNDRGPIVQLRTFESLRALGLIERKGFTFVPTADAWALAHKGGLR